MVFPMVRTFTLTTQKGGTGKTTLATSLAVAAMHAGEQVVAFDLDPQGSLVAWGKLRGVDGLHVERFPPDKVGQLPAMMKALGSKGFTVAILDTPGADNTATHQAMEAASMCLVPIRPTRLDANAVKPTVQALLRGDTLFSFILNQCPPTPRNGRAAEMASGLAALGYLAEPMVVQRADYQDAYAAGQGVTEYAPEGKAAEEMRQLWRWIDNQSKGAKQ
jgi:chromosome partitioning protein